jgi:hypothetical protein
LTADDRNVLAVPLKPDGVRAAPPARPAVAEILEDDAAGLLDKLKSKAGQGLAETAEVFSGTQAVKIIPMQVYDRAVPGWKYRIVEKPKAGEYRYLRFAWKADGCAGVMLQLHDVKDWYIRYTAGQNTQGWEAKFVADAPPADWAVVTRDLYADFGERTIQGLALTAFGGRAAYFDHIYLGRSVEDLDRIDATGAAAGKPKALAPDELARLWQDLGGASAPRAYAALWRLRASPAEAVPFLKGKLTASVAGPDAARIRQWVRDLDAARYPVREAATRKLGEHVEAAAPLLEESLRGTPSPEARERAEKLLAGRPGDPAGHVLRAVRALEYAETPSARACLEELAKGPEGARPTVAARAALGRLATPDRDGPKDN